MNEPQRNEQFDKGAAMNMAYFLALSYSTCFSVFMRKGFGAEALGYNGLAAFGAILFCIDGDRCMAAFFLLWLCALAAQRFITFLRARKGIRPHSLYAGDPILVWKLMPFVKNETMVQMGEALLCLLVGGALCSVSERLGTFVACGFFSLVIQRAIEGQVWMMRVRRMRDAEIEQRTLVELYKEH